MNGRVRIRLEPQDDQAFHEVFDLAELRPPPRTPKSSMPRSQPALRKASCGTMGTQLPRSSIHAQSMNISSTFRIGWFGESGRERKAR